MDNGGVASGASLSSAMLQEAKDGLFIAAENGRADVIKALIEYGGQQLDLRQLVDPTTNQTPLHMAVRHDKTDAVRALLAANFPPEITATGNSNGFDNSNALSAYQLARRLGNGDVVRVFHQFLIQQVAADDVDQVKKLLDAGLEVDLNDGKPLHNSLLHWAASCGAEKVLALLLNRVKNQFGNERSRPIVNALNSDGATPLHDACHSGHVQCVKLLLDHQADATIRGKKGFCADRIPQQVTSQNVILRLFNRPAEHIASTTTTTTTTTTDSKVTSCTVMNGSKDGCSVTHGGDQDVQGLASRQVQDQSSAAPQVRDLQQQLEEKNGLIAQLKQTIESLATELEENQKVGEEKLVLEYIRKLRKEKEVLVERLDETERFIQMQQEQHLQLKHQIRFLTAQVEELQAASFRQRPSPRITSRSTSRVAPPDRATRRLAPRREARDETLTMEKDDVQQPKSQREESSLHHVHATNYPHLRKTRLEALALRSPGFWDDVKDMIWPVEEEEPEQKPVLDLGDEEMVMTV